MSRYTIQAKTKSGTLVFVNRSYQWNHAKHWMFSDNLDIATTWASEAAAKRNLQHGNFYRNSGLDMRTLKVIKMFHG